MGESLTRREVIAAAATLVLAGTDQPVDLSKAHLRVAGAQGGDKPMNKQTGPALRLVEV